MFFVTLISVAIMLLYAVPGFLLVKSKLVKPAAIPAFATLLMYVCQPCLTIYAFQKVDYTPQLAGQIAVVFGLGLLIMGAVLGIFAFFVRKKYDDARWRVANLCAAFGNCTFIGLPLVEALLPDYPQAVVFSMAFFIAMSVLGWTVGSTLITRDFSYCRPLKVVLNPAVLSLAAALPLFFFHVSLPDQLGSAITLMGKMSTPLCMLVVGMRLATVPLRRIFTDKLQYLAVGVKQLVMPLIALLFVSFLPLEPNLKLTVYILSCCPVAAVVLTFAEMLGEGQDSAANGVLLGTLLSIVTLPLMLLLVA